MPAVPDPSLTRRFNERIPLRDGITLAADLVLPRERPAPAVVLRTPYGRSSELATARADAFARGGYVAVWVDVRGRGDSEGTFAPYRHDGVDGVDVIAWAAEQEWCDGQVATCGGSYSGQIQWLTALHRPPALAAMIVLVTPADPFVVDPTGLPGPMHIHWYRMTDGRAMQYTDAVDWMAVYRYRPHLELDTAAGFSAPMWREACGHQTLDEWWAPLCYQTRIGEIDVPVLHISGWYDDEEIGTPANFAAMHAAGRGGQRLLMGPWGHQINHGRQLGDFDFGAEAVVDLEAIQIGFLDEMVRQRTPSEPPAPVRAFLMGANVWRTYGDWPPPGAVQRALYLDSDGRANSRFGDGRLSEAAPAPGAPADTWTHDPDRPVPFITAPTSAQLGGPDDYSGVQTRGDVLVFVTEPLSAPLDVVGPVRLIAHVQTTAHDADITAMLCDVHPGGYAQRLCDGLVRLRYRDGHDGIAEVHPDTVYEIEVVMWDTSQRFLPGHRVGLQVASSAHPKFAVNLGTPGDQSTQTEAVIAHNTLHHDAGRPSRLILTVVPEG